MRKIFPKICTISMLALLCLLFGTCAYSFLAMNPPPDANKTPQPHNKSCYLATASNMLAGAGYGTGTTVQERATNIYGDMIAQFGTANGGWVETALTWWLSSAHNTWTNNPYSAVAIIGNTTKKPWSNPQGAEIIGNTLRSGSFVGLGISWPRKSATGSPYGSHAITAWGDDVNSANALTTNPKQVMVTDSDDSDTAGGVHTYSYDDYTNPNPGGYNEGKGWYFNYNYGANHPYIKHITTLSPTKYPSGNSEAQNVTGSIQIAQDNETAATDLHYHVGTDINILSYRTETDWLDTIPTITEDNPRNGIQVDWDFSNKPVPHGTIVTITTQFILPCWNSISYHDINFTYPDGAKKTKLPYLKWFLTTPRIDKATSIASVTGGYVVGSFDILEPLSHKKIASYRFIHQYSYDQNPELHQLEITGTKGFMISNLRLGHSYGLLTTKQLWGFEKWMSDYTSKEALTMDPERPAKIVISWKGRLPYPEGDN